MSTALLLSNSLLKLDSEPSFIACRSGVWKQVRADGGLTHSKTALDSEVLNPCPELCGERSQDCYVCADLPPQLRTLQKLTGTVSTLPAGSKAETMVVSLSFPLFSLCWRAGSPASGCALLADARPPLLL